MNRPVILNADAEADLAKAKEWYDLQSYGLGDELLAAVETVLDAIGRMPEMYAVDFESLRVATVRRFPYLVVYRIDDDQITVVAVYNAYRDPQGWQSRA